jgi:phospholipase C
MTHKMLLSAAAAAMALAMAGCSSSSNPGAPTPTPTPTNPTTALGTPVTPIQHVIVIFGENISYDHYYGTYPKIAYAGANPANSAEIDQTNFPATATAPRQQQPAGAAEPQHLGSDS